MFDADHWLSILHREPVVLILMAGLLAGSGLAQTVKKLYLGYFPKGISDARYRATMNVLAIACTYLITLALWREVIPTDGSGLERVSSLASALCAPLAYKLTKALVAWKFPDFAAKWGD
jgi:hypothetical protein